MSTVETIEYFEHCPSCGASHDGTGTCPYCGGSMVKNRVVTDLKMSQEDAILREDANLPIIDAKNGKVSSFLKIFCPLFGGIFLAVPTFLCGVFYAVDLMEPFMLLFFSIFLIIGAGALVPLVKAISAQKRCKDGQRLVGVVRGYNNSNMTVNDEHTKVIRVRVDEGGPRVIVFDTGETKRVYPVGSKIALRTDGTYYLIEGSAQ